MDNTLYQKLYHLFIHELISVNIGHEYDVKSIDKMIDLINANDLLKTNLSRSESLKIINFYE